MSQVKNKEEVKKIDDLRQQTSSSLLSVPINDSLVCQHVNQYFES